MSTKVSTDLIDLSGNTGGLVWAKGPTTDQPASATAGEMRVDTTTNTTVVYTGTQWKTLKETAFVVPPVPTHFLVVAGGGSGALQHGGGGGAGGLRTSYGSTSGGGANAESTIGISLNTSYTITVGEGGAGVFYVSGNVSGNNGYNSLFSNITSIGGGGGSSYATQTTEKSGGSGGGGGNQTSGSQSGGAGTTGQGYAGGAGSTSSTNYPSGGGGGAGGLGGNGTAGVGGNGGIGLSLSITGSSVTYAGGGGSATYAGGTPGTGGSGIGGAGKNNNSNGNSGTYNTGSGGGGTNGTSGTTTGSGGSGVVILRYPTADLPYFTTTGTLNTPSATDTVADTAYPVTNTAYYKLDNNANDSGLGSGYIGQGGIFNGSSSVVTLPSALSDGITTDAVCMSFWFNVGAEVTSSTSNNEIMSFAGNGKIALGSTSGSITSETFSVTSNVSNQYTYSRTNIPAGWNHAVVQWNSGTGKWDIYINGVANTTYTFGTNQQSKWAIKFGQRSTFYYNGILDQVRIFPTVLSSSNIALLYAETSATSSTLNYPVTATALYEFSGNADSTSSSAYNGTATDVLYAYNGTASNVTYGNGRFNEAGNFNGSSSYITLGNVFNSVLSNNFTISTWVNVDSMGGQIFGKGIWAANGEYVRLYTRTSTPRIQFGFEDGSGNNVSMSSNSENLEGTGWRHIVAVGDYSGSFSLYLDGQHIESQTVNGSMNMTNSNSAYIGNRESNNAPFNGSIDQVRIFSSALAPGDVEDLYNEHFQTKFTDGSDTALKFTGGTGDITFADTAPVFTPSENFNTVLYTGNSSTQAITGVGFAPDFTWIKQRNITQNHRLFDSVRGATNILSSSNNNAQGTNSQTLTSFNSNGFSLGNNVAVNTNSGTYVAWNWKAGGAARNNTDGSIASLVSANVDAGFSIVKYTSTGANNTTIGHGLSSAPELIFFKKTTNTGDWITYTQATGADKYLFLNRSDSEGTASGLFNNINSTTFNLISGYNDYNQSGQDYIAYCFHSVDGFSKIGSYTGTGATGNVQYVGFEPAFVMVKATSTSEPWFILDNKRDPNNPRDNRLMPDSTAAESNGSVHTMDFNSNNFTLNGTVGNGTNGSGQTYIFLAIAADPT